MSMTELERVTNQRDYNRRLADHQQTVIDHLNAEITAMQDDTREKRVVMNAAKEHLVAALEAISENYPRGDMSHEDFRVSAAHLAGDALAAFRAATGAA